ncbi:MAG: methylaspartate mutase, partial [Anaerolineae bacterium]|nr:methylaspartate mutase [Anaerolineae bacterium]
PLSTVAMVNPLAAAQVTERDALHNLGTVVAPVGSAREGEIALKFKIAYEDGRSLEVEVPYGSLEVIPLATGQTADLELRPTRRFDVGLGTR